MSEKVLYSSTRRADPGRALAADRWLLTRLLHAIGDPPLRFVLWDGSELCFSADKPIGRVLIHDRNALLNLLFNPNLKFGDGFADGSIEIDGDFIDCLKILMRSTPRRIDQGITGRLQRLLPDLKAGSLSAARNNIHRHYDIGNDFYRLWLDEEMVYTCAYYTSADCTLAEAQMAKMEHVCRKLRLKPGEEVIEAGCGWGSLARYMALRHGVRVRAYNISHEQIDHARRRARAEGIDDRVEYIEDDYRNIQGSCDAFVSVGMLEHVGEKNYRALGGVIDRTLKDNGRGLIHSVGCNSEQPIGQWVQRRIFPGAYVPSLSQAMQVLEPYAFSVLDVENLRLHYARTLHDWLQRFDAVSDQAEQRFDASFVRAWRLYLGGCSAAFAAGNLQLFQLLFNREQSNDVPWTRAHLYRE